MTQGNQILCIIASSLTTKDYMMDFQFRIFVFTFATLALIIIPIKNSCFSIFEPVISTLLIAPMSYFFISK